MRAGFARPDGVTLRLLLVRHGAPEASARGRCYGKLDVGLSDAGREQMERVRGALGSSGLGAVISSPRTRALESAKILCTDVTIDARLGEIDFGVLEGLSYDQARERFPDVYHRWMREPTEVQFPGGECFDDMRRRVLDALVDIRSRYVDETVAIVSHGGVNRTVLAEALRMEKRHIFHLGQSYAGISAVDDRNGYWVVDCVNVTC